MGLSFHGTDDQLEAYALGRLGGSELAVLEEHLIVCPECRSRLSQIESFSTGMKQALAATPAAHGPVPKRPAWSGWLRRPAVSMTAALVASVAIISIISNRPKVAPVLSLTLTSTRGEMPVTAPARELDLTLANSPTDGGVFRVEILNVVGETVWSGLAQSTASGIQLKTQREIPPGDYFVRLYAASGDVLREYGFRVKQ